MQPVQVDQHQQRGDDQELVGDRIEEGTERRGLVEPARQIAVGPVGQATMMNSTVASRFCIPAAMFR